MTPKNRKKFIIHVLKCCMFFFEVRRLPLLLGVLYGGLGISELKFLIKNTKFLF
jgi:hypothetical protein